MRSNVSVEDIKVSVIIPLYNVEKYIKRAMDSVLSQNLREIEVICIDNVSTDRTRQIVEEYGKRDGRIHLVCNEKNEGIAYSRNLGLKIAKGKYIFFLDADDELLPDVLEELYENASSKNLEILYFDAIIRYEKEELELAYKDKILNKEEMEKPYKEMFPNKEELSDEVKRGNRLFAEFIGNACYTNVLWRQFILREMIAEHNICFRERYLHEDIWFSLQVILSANRAAFIRKTCYAHYKRVGSLTTAEVKHEGLKSYLVAYADMLCTWQSMYQNDIVVGRALSSYLNEFYKMIMRNYQEVRGKEEVQFDNPFYEHIYRCFLMEKSLLSKEQREIVKKYDSIILYGAGKIANQVLQEINKNAVIGFAVTDMKGNEFLKAGLPVKVIHEYSEYKTSALIIVATAERFHSQILKVLSEEGYENVIYIR